MAEDEGEPSGRESLIQRLASPAWQTSSQKVMVYKMGLSHDDPDSIEGHKAQHKFS